MSIENVKQQHEAFRKSAVPDPNMTQGYKWGQPLIDLLSSLVKHHEEVEQRLAKLESEEDSAQPD